MYSNDPQAAEQQKSNHLMLIGLLIISLIACSVIVYASLVSGME